MFLPLWSPRVGTVALGGNRYLGNEYIKMIEVMANNILLAGNRLSVGCCVGADSYAIQGVLNGNSGYLHNVDCFTICNEALEGGCSLTATGLVASLAVRSFDSVRWSANLALPLRARLAIRTGLVVQSANVAVLFFGNGVSKGTKLAACTAAKKGIPIYAFGANPPLIGKGFWVSAHFFGCNGYRWVYPKR